MSGELLAAFLVNINMQISFICLNAWPGLIEARGVVSRTPYNMQTFRFVLFFVVVSRLLHLKSFFFFLHLNTSIKN